MKTFHAACTAVIVTITSAVTPASAGVITTNDLPNGTNNAAFVIDGVGVSVTTSGGNFIQKIGGGTTATGIEGGAAIDEIDNTEWLLFTFDVPVHIQTLSIAYLYMAGQAGDTANESALFETSAGNFSFTVNDAITAFWDGSGFYVNTSPAVTSSGASWLIFGDSIFGGAITTIAIKSGNPGNGLEFGDYGFRYIEFTPIPSPGALALLMIAGITGFSRRCRVA